MEDLSRGEEWLNCGGSIDYGSEGALIGSRLLVQVAVELGEELVEGVGRNIFGREQLGVEQDNKV